MLELCNRVIDMAPVGSECGSVFGASSGTTALIALSFPVFFGIVIAVFIVLLLFCGIAIRRIIFDDGRTDFSSQLEQQPAEDEQQSDESHEVEPKPENAIDSPNKLIDSGAVSHPEHRPKIKLKSSDTIEVSGSAAIETQEDDDRLNRPARELRSDPGQAETEISTDAHFSRRQTNELTDEQNLVSDDSDEKLELP